MLTAEALAASGEGTVGAVMATSPCVASSETPIDELLPILSGGLYQEAAVVDHAGALLGLITQTDLLSALWRGHIAEQIALTGAG